MRAPFAVSKDRRKKARINRSAPHPPPLFDVRQKTQFSFLWMGGGAKEGSLSKRHFRCHARRARAKDVAFNGARGEGSRQRRQMERITGRNIHQSVFPTTAGSLQQRKNPPHLWHRQRVQHISHVISAATDMCPLVCAPLTSHLRRGPLCRWSGGQKASWLHVLL